MLDEVRVYGRALTEAGALALYEGRHTPLFADGFEAGDTLAWPLTVP